MKNLVIMAVIGLLLGCASSDPLLVKKETRDVTHFITFRSDPVGADVLVVNSLTGKEVGFFGKTPVRILILRKTVEVNGMNQVTVTKLDPAAFAVTYGGKYSKKSSELTLLAEGAEFQFKFRMPGYFDEIKLERIPFQTGNDTDTTININLKLTK